MTEAHAPPRDRVTLGAFGVSVLIGGSNFVAVRLSNRELDPLWGAGARFAVAAGVFGVILLVLGLKIPRGRNVNGLVTYGLLAFGAAYGLLYWGMQDVPAGVAAVVMAAGPLLTLLLATAHGMETLHVRALAGAVVALAGSALMFFAPGESQFGWLSLAAVCLAAVCAAESVVVAKRCESAHPAVMNFVGMGVGACALLAVSAASGEDWALPREPATILAFGYLAAASVVMFILVLMILRGWTASASAYIFVMMPLVAVGVGALLADEPITAGTVLGGFVVLIGVYVGALSRNGTPSRGGPDLDPRAPRAAG